MDHDVLDLDLAQVILTAYNADGFLGIGLDVYGEQASGTGTFEAHYPTGIYSRPRDPANGIGCAALKAYNGNDRHCWPANDPRAIAKLPEGPKGSTFVFGDTGRTRIPFVYFDGETGSVQTYVPHASSTTASVFAIDVATEGAESIQMAHGAGMGLSMTAGGSYSTILHNRLGNVYLEINDTGATINGNTQVVGSLIAGDIQLAVPVALGPASLAYISAVETWALQIDQVVGPLVPSPQQPAYNAAVTARQLAFQVAVQPVGGIQATLVKAW